MNTLQKLKMMLEDPARRRNDLFLDLVPYISCKDGFKVSVQASNTHYCEPRDDNGPWSKVECGFPTEAVPCWLEYAADKDRPTDTVYGYVPILLVVEALDSHGGII